MQYCHVDSEDYQYLSKVLQTLISRVILTPTALIQLLSQILNYLNIATEYEALNTHPGITTLKLVSVIKGLKYFFQRDWLKVSSRKSSKKKLLSGSDNISGSDTGVKSTQDLEIWRYQCRHYQYLLMSKLFTLGFRRGDVGSVCKQLFQNCSKDQLWYRDLLEQLAMSLRLPWFFLHSRSKQFVEKQITEFCPPHSDIFKSEEKEVKFQIPCVSLYY